MYLLTYISKSVLCTYSCRHVHSHISIICICTYVHTYMCIHICIHICTHICIHICTHICIHICTVQLISNLMLACTNSQANGLFSRSPLSRFVCSIPLLASVPSRACARVTNQCLSTSSLACMQARVLTGRLYS